MFFHDPSHLEGHFLPPAKTENRRAGPGQSGAHRTGIQGRSFQDVIIRDLVDPVGLSDHIIHRPPYQGIVAGDQSRYKSGQVPALLQGGLQGQGGGDRPGVSGGIIYSGREGHRAGAGSFAKPICLCLSNCLSGYSIIQLYYRCAEITLRVATNENQVDYRRE